jgi:hypothetical protein
MPGLLFHQGAIMNCPDQGLAAIAAPSQVRVTVNGMPVAVLGDQIAIAGCKLPAPHVKVEWLQLSTRVKVDGRPVLLQPLPSGPGAGNCVPAPAPPDIKQMQTRVTGT